MLCGRMQSDPLDRHLTPPASCPWNAIEARVLLPHPGHRHQVPSLSSDLLPVGADLLQSFCHPRVLDPPNWSGAQTILSTYRPLVSGQVDSRLYTRLVKVFLKVREIELSGLSQPPFKSLMGCCSGGVFPKHLGELSSIVVFRIDPWLLSKC